ncbi:uncharacterized protein LOC143294271 [Babylonia areolata]|uniref:uncharacterized protein LOC143294271 n=1 Tax=Babylonia areolata TaxID=304850 RepID=UPI003FD390F8
MLYLERPFSVPRDELVSDSHSYSQDGGCARPAAHRQEPTTTTTTTTEHLYYLPTEMRSESSRLQTFYSWPFTMARTLARYGFYVGSSVEGDCIRCAFCGLEVSGFRNCQEVELWHWQVAGRHCPLLTGRHHVEEDEKDEETSVWAVTARERPGPGDTDGRTERLQLLRSGASPGGEERASPARIDLSPGTSDFRMPTFFSAGAAAISQQLTKAGSSRTSSSHVLKAQAESTSRLRQERNAAPIPRPSSTVPSHAHQATCNPASSSTTTTITTSSTTPSDGGGSPWVDIVKTARFADMAAYQARLSSLSSWPLLSPTPRALARAGLFRDKTSSSSSSSSSCLLVARSVRGPSTTTSMPGERRTPGQDCCQSPGPSSDSVCCFWCGVRLHRWRKSDDPVLEHARLSPDCRYVIQLLGHQLHRDIITAFSPCASRN